MNFLNICWQLDGEIRCDIFTSLLNWQICSVYYIFSAVCHLFSPWLPVSWQRSLRGLTGLKMLSEDTSCFSLTGYMKTGKTQLALVSFNIWPNFVKTPCNLQLLSKKLFLWTWNFMVFWKFWYFMCT